MNRKQVAQETVEALERGTYQTPSGTVVDFAAQLASCIAGTRYYSPEDLEALQQQVLSQTAAQSTTSFVLVNETTLIGTARLVMGGKYRCVGALNFASAKNPGGGFLGGAQAQEESLARSSGLYKSLLECRTYYAQHRAQHTSLYSDRMIYSPACPVLRTDDGRWLEAPYLVDFLTSPAPNAGAIAKNEPHRLAEIQDIFHARAGKMLALAAHQGCDALVLGAWGCGAFRNDPELVVSVFWDYLNPGGAFWGRFHTVLFSVLDTSPTQKIYGAFVRRFGPLIPQTA